MGFTPADPKEMKKLLKGRKSLLLERVERENKQLEGKVCPECGSPTYPVLRGPGPFTLQVLLQCTYCKVLFEPDTGIIVKFGEAYEPMPVRTDLFVNADEDPQGS
jgi:hypothetical protein